MPGDARLRDKVLDKNAIVRNGQLNIYLIFAIHYLAYQNQRSYLKPSIFARFLKPREALGGQASTTWQSIGAEIRKL